MTTAARKAQWVAYNLKNSDQRKAKAKVKIQCVCGSEYNYSGKTQHTRTNKHQKYIEKKTALI